MTNDRPTRCAIHDEDTTPNADGIRRCAVCDHLAHMPHKWGAWLRDHYDLSGSGLEVPDELTIRGWHDHEIPRFTTKQNAPAAPWGDLLELLPTISQSQTSDLKVDTGSVRVWLSRLTIEDGAPFDRTVEVEALSRGRWLDIGYFDGDGPDPRPLGTLGDGWNATYRRLGVEIL